VTSASGNETTAWRGTSARGWPRARYSSGSSISLRLCRPKAHLDGGPPAGYAPTPPNGLTAGTKYLGRFSYSNGSGEIGSTVVGIDG
jgi:hypothetical protein